eukprot:gene19472-biopygen6097
MDIDCVIDNLFVGVTVIDSVSELVTESVIALVGVTVIDSVSELWHASVPLKMLATLRGRFSILFGLLAGLVDHQGDPLSPPGSTALLLRRKKFLVKLALEICREELAEVVFGEFRNSSMTPKRTMEAVARLGWPLWKLSEIKGELASPTIFGRLMPSIHACT